MKLTNRFFVAVFLIATPSLVMAQVNNVGSCGLGSRLWQGEKSVPAQVLAVTTNGVSGNQTFGITSGTSGCSSNGVVSSNWKTAMFIDANMNKLALNMSTGRGEALESLAELLEIPANEKSNFYNLTKKEFGRIFAAADISSVEVSANLKRVLVEDSALQPYSAKL